MIKLKPPFVYGVHAVKEALKNKNRKNKFIYLTEELYEEIKPSIDFKIVKKSDLNILLGYDIVHQGIVLETSYVPIMHIEDFFEDLPEKCQIIILDQVSDPQNIGAIARTSAAFGVKAIIQQEKNAPNISSPIITKTACGGVEHVNFINVTNLSRAIKQLQDNNFWVIGLDERGEQTIDNTDLKGRIAFVMGREGKGIRSLLKEKCDQLVKLPTNSNFPTLNVSNASAVTIYEWYRQNV